MTSRLSTRVSVIIATYNRYKDLRECLVSLFDLNTKPFEVIVVDSFSVDDTRKLKNCFPIKFVSIKKRNRQSARNLGISIASGDIIAFLDDDVIVHRNWLESIVELYSDNRVGGVGGRVVPYGTSDKIYVRTSRNEVGKVFNSGLVLGNFDFLPENPIEVDSLIGCNMSFRRELLVRVEGFDENFIGTGFRDDTDLCLRIRKLGYKLLFHPEAMVWHKFKGKQIGSEWLYWYVRNHMYFYFKNIFIQSRCSFPFALYHMLFPPRDYALKSGIKLKIEPKLVINALKGLIDGYKTWKFSTS